MKLSISNIAWTSEHDDEMYALLQSQGYSGLEIAPTRIFPEKPYERIDEAREFAAGLKSRFGLSVSSIQSIWYSRTESIFGTSRERSELVDYTKKAVDFATSIDCKNIVFGCPKSRNIPDNCADYMRIAAEFFTEISDYAASNGTVIALEPNPTIYGTNFINTTIEAFEFIKRLNTPGLKVNVDFGTVVYNAENLNVIRDNIHLVNHIHISEPELVIIKKRRIHNELAAILRETGYSDFVSIEMKLPDNIEEVKFAAAYVKSVFVGDAEI